jgi:hypothetical protein
MSSHREHPPRPTALVIALGVALAIAGGAFGASALLGDHNASRVALRTGGRDASAGPTEPPPASSPSVIPETQSTAAALPSPVATTTQPASPPHFDTPEAAMTYLAAAWNRMDTVALGHVTNPAARAQLEGMHAEAANLRLDHCDRRPQRDYTCYFLHDYPVGYPMRMHRGAGKAIFLVGPAIKPGWYMTVFQSCG